ncbi:hypothetical protein DFJ74DRAFT_129474 [Hyaloraphidium curvatum]|nr:hypothetical protein DFJ74DRAFT_129474 [Hyaloraphidium curvatum]
MVARQAGEWLDEGLRSEDWDQALGFKEVWEPVAVKAEDLDGAPAEESISLPVQASAPIVDVFFRVCQDMNRIGGHLLEKSTLQRLLSSLSRSFEATFARFVSDFADAISDKGALQLLFDLSFVSKVLGDAKLEMDAEHSSRAKQHLADLVPRVRRMVDPIDLSISDRHIGTNVERFFYRTSVLFGPLSTT